MQNIQKQIENIKNIIENQFENSQFNKEDKKTQKAIENTIELLGEGKIRIAQKQENGQYYVNTWIKKAILLYFKSKNMKNINNAPGGTVWWDKINPKFAGWNDNDFIKAGIRCVPGSFVREGSYIAPKVVLMPCFVNIGAYVDQAAMIDAWATVGSCAQIGKNVHISGGAGIGGVLEPLQANPVIIEDDCFIGARAEVAEGVIVEKGAVLAMGVYISASTKIIDRNTGQVFYGRIPAYSVVVPGSVPPKKQNSEGTIPSLYCAVIIKKVDAKTREKVSINKLLRE